MFINVRQSDRWIDVIANPHSAILACIRMGVHNRRATSSSRESAPLFQPTSKRVLTFARRLSENQILDANVFIEIGPVNSLSISNPSPLISLLGSAVNK